MLVTQLLSGDGHVRCPVAQVFVDVFGGVPDPGSLLGDDAKAEIAVSVAPDRRAPGVPWNHRTKGPSVVSNPPQLMKGLLTVDECPCVVCSAALGASDARRMCLVRPDIDPDHVHS